MNKLPLSRSGERFINKHRRPAVTLVAALAVLGLTAETPSRCGTYSGMTCEASYYGGPEDTSLNTYTANGEVFDANAMTAASRDLAFGTWVQVTNSDGGKDNGKSVSARINDRGPAAWTGRCIDLTKGAFSIIANPSTGHIRVTISYS